MLRPSRDRGPRRRRGRILYSLLVVLILVGLAPLGTVGWKLIDINREALTTSTQEVLLLRAQLIALQMDVRVDALRSQLSRMAGVLGSQLAGPTQPSEEEIRKVLGEVADDRMLFLRFLDFRGRKIDTPAAYPVAADLEALFVVELRKAAESIAEKSGRFPERAIASSPVPPSARTQRAVVVLTAPVPSGGSFRGVLSAVVDLQSVWDEVVRENRRGHTVFALDPRGHLFARSGSEGLTRDDELAHSELALRFLSSPDRGTGVTMPFRLESGGRSERYLGSCWATQEGWGVFVQAREGQVYLPVRAMIENTLWWALGVMGFAVLAAIVFAGQLSRPIGRLAAASRAFADGNLNAHADVRDRNEIGELAETFNGMAKEIGYRMGQLKQAADENKKLFLGTIRALAKAIDTKDPYTRGHSERVEKYAVILATYLKLSKEEIEDIKVASLLHDMGKIVIDDSILKGEHVLTPEERKLVEAHTERGASIMAPIPKMEKFLPGLRSHHERWNGGGYPDGLAGDAIPLMARIIAAADIFDAITTDRPYQKKKPFDDAAKRLNELKGECLDERVIEAFNRAYRAGEFRPVEERVAVEEGAAV